MNRRRYSHTSPVWILTGIIMMCGTVSAQQISTNAVLTITNSGSPQASRTLEFGVNPEATNGIDVELGEDNFPPFPPSAVFEARFVSSGGSDLGEGSPADIRPFTNTSQSDEYKVKFQAGTNGLPIHIEWDLQYLKDHYSSVSMKDPFGGVILEVDMLATASAEVSNTNLTEVVIVASGPKDPNLGVEDETGAREMSAILIDEIGTVSSDRVPVRFRLRSAAAVSMSVADMTGSILTTVYAGELKSEGVHYEHVDISELGSGTYFMMVTVEGGSDVRRFVVIR